MAAEGDSPAAHEVADAFVLQYYNILQKLPEEARRLYVEDSVVGRPGPDGTMMSYKSVEAINEQILSCDYKSAGFEIASIDSQNSYESGVFIVVIGFLTGKDELKRKFSQSFYLARQSNTYVVLNDILRYVDDVSSPPTTAVTPAPELLNETALVADTPVQPEPTVHIIETPVDNFRKVDDEPSAPTTALSLEPEPVNETTEPAYASVQPELVHKIEVPAENNENGKGNVFTQTVSDRKVGLVEGSAGTSEKIAQPVGETTVSKSLHDTTKRSFASIVQSLAQNSAPFKVKPSTFKPKPVAHPRAIAAPKAPAPVVESEKKTDPKNTEEPGTSIFVGNLPMSAMPDQLHEVFSKFGPVKEDGIQVRSYKQKGICFGFVAFESASSVQNLLQAAQASPFMLGDRKLRVKEKQVDYDGGKASGTNNSLKNQNRNQNGSANEGFKPRDNFSKSRRYGRNGYEKRGDKKTGEDDQNQVNENGGEKIAPQVQDSN